MLTITNEDNMALMSRYTDKYFDLAIVDPPYGINVTKMNMGGRKTVKPNKKNWDNITPDDTYFNELKRVSKEYIVWGANYFEQIELSGKLKTVKDFLDFVNLKSKYTDNWIIWDKGETMYGRDFNECELAYCSINGISKIFKKSPNQLQRFHPTQKPVALYKWILDKYAKQGDKILDTHLGSGSVAIACHDYGFDLTACELDKEYYDKSMERLKNHTNQVKLF